MPCRTQPGTHDHQEIFFESHLPLYDSSQASAGNVSKTYSDTSIMVSGKSVSRTCPFCSIVPPAKPRRLNTAMIKSRYHMAGPFMFGASGCRGVGKKYTHGKDLNFLKQSSIDRRCGVIFVSIVRALSYLLHPCAYAWSVTGGIPAYVYVAMRASLAERLWEVNGRSRSESLHMIGQAMLEP